MGYDGWRDNRAIQLRRCGYDGETDGVVIWQAALIGLRKDKG